MIVDAYRVEGVIGAGSMGEVYRAVDTGLDRPVAIKLLLEKHRDNPELRRRFVREGRAVAAISHPNVVQVFATGSFDDRPYIAMELLDGTDLGSEVERNGPLPASAAAHAILDAAQGLCAAAKAGLIHRDVKPSNLVRLKDTRVKVTDFGLAKPVDPGSEPALTAMGVVVGTPDYIAPEQARGDDIDERVDLYALGGTLYFLITGSPPFRTGRPADDKYLKVVARHLRSPVPDARERNPACDRELALLAMALMAKLPSERPSYADLVAELTHLIARLDPGSVVDVVSSTRERSRPIAPAIGNQSRTSSSLVRDSQESGGGPRTPGPPVNRYRGESQADAPASLDELMVAQPRFPRWLIGLTLACIALFVTGLVSFVSRDDAPVVRHAAVPAGMVLVKRRDGSPWFYVDVRPVTTGAYTQVFGEHRQTGAPEDPVVLVSYDGARSFASTRGGRLLRNDEWDAAIATAGVAVSEGKFEWVESPEGSRTVRQRGKTEVRDSGAEQRDVTFRVGRDP